jgi:hypothetical protein
MEGKPSNLVLRGYITAILPISLFFPLLFLTLIHLDIVAHTVALMAYLCLGSGVYSFWCFLRAHRTVNSQRWLKIGPGLFLAAFAILLHLWGVWAPFRRAANWILFGR